MHTNIDILVLSIFLKIILFLSLSPSVCQHLAVQKDKRKEQKHHRQSFKKQKTNKQIKYNYTRLQNGVVSPESLSECGKSAGRGESMYSTKAVCHRRRDSILVWEVKHPLLFPP